MLRTNASSGHKLGQLIGDWYEEYFVLPLLQEAGRQLGLFVDSRFINRKVRESKILWNDIYGNSTDYDYVLELNGANDTLGIPVAFIECFWRRGSRHSKDKARDDSGKLVPMRDTYPTARFLGIVAAGDFTAPARELVKSREIDLFYIPKEKIVSAFSSCGLVMDYPDKLPEKEKAKIVKKFDRQFSAKKKNEVQQALCEGIGKPTITSYIDRIRATLSALPQEIRLILRHDSMPVTFETVEKATIFLKSPNFHMASPMESYLYQVTYSDGSEFEKSVSSLDGLKLLHEQIEILTKHMNKLCKN